jgi:hypothetical protein
MSGGCTKTFGGLHAACRLKIPDLGTSTYLLLIRKCETENYNEHCHYCKKHGFLQVMQEIIYLFFQSKVLYIYFLLFLCFIQY